MADSHVVYLTSSKTTSGTTEMTITRTIFLQLPAGQQQESGSKAAPAPYPKKARCEKEVSVTIL